MYTLVSFKLKKKFYFLIFQMRNFVLVKSQNPVREIDLC